MHRSLIVVLLSLLLVTGPAPAATSAARDAAILRGLAWIEAHPASREDGGFRDLVDEALFHLVTRDLPRPAGAPAAAPARRRALGRLAAALQSGTPGDGLLDHYHRLLALHLLELAGRSPPRRAALLDAARTALAQPQRANPAVRLAVAVLLARLGARSPLDPRRLLPGSFAWRIAHAGGGQVLPTALRGHPYLYYALVHEIAVLTDFGRLPPPAWMARGRALLLAVLREGLALTRASGNRDLLAELLLSWHILRGDPQAPAVQRALDDLVASQQADGSWGRQTPHRDNALRHAVQTATAALLVFRPRTAGGRVDSGGDVPPAPSSPPHASTSDSRSPSGEQGRGEGDAPAGL